MKFQSKWGLLLAGAAIAVLAAGCGGDGSAGADDGYTPEHSTTVTVAKPPLTKARFVRRVNKLCRETWVTVLGNWDGYTDRQDRKLSEDERFAEAVRAVLLAGIVFYIFDGIREIGSPPGEAEEIEAIIGPFQAQVELGWKERWQAHSAADVVERFATYNERARAYGLDDCLVSRAHLRPIDDF